MEKGIGIKIKENIKFRNLTMKDTAELLNISEKHLSEIINNKQQISLDLAAKLDRIFGFKIGTVFIMQERNKINNNKNRKEFEDIVLTLQKYDVFKDYDPESLKFQVASMLPVEYNEYIEFLDRRNVNFNMYVNKPMALLWFAIMDKRHGHKKADGKFNVSNGKSVINQSLKIMFGDHDQKERISELKEILDKNGIVLATEPFFPNSTMTGVSYGENLKKGKQRFIFLNDYKKREYSFIFSLVHELFHVYNMMDREDNVAVSNYIYKYMEKHNIDHELKYAMEIYGNNKLSKKEQGDLVYKKTKKELKFGDALEVLKQELLTI